MKPKRSYPCKLTQIARLKKIIRELLDCYWGPGDGETPPEFITRAAKLAGWKHKARK